MITENTKNAFIVTEVLEEEYEEDMNNLLDFIVTNTEKYLKGKAYRYILDKNNRQIEL